MAPVVLAGPDPAMIDATLPAEWQKPLGASPRLIIELPKSSEEVCISGDGQWVVSIRYEPVMKMGRLLGYWVLEVTLAVSALVIVLALWLSIRVHRRRRVLGEAYCRKCNYQLTGSTSRTCAECGNDHSRHGPAVGRPPWRSWALTGIVVALCLLGTLHAASHKRVTADLVEKLLEGWHSRWVYTWRDRWPDITLDATECIVDVYDARSGTKARSVSLGISTIIWDSCPSADARHLYFVKGDLNVYRLDLHTQEIATLPIRPALKLEFMTLHGMSDDGTYLYLDDRINLYSVNVETGESLVILESDKAKSIGISWGLGFYAFSPSYKQFVFVHSDGIIRLADSSSGHVDQHLRSKRYGKDPWVDGLAVDDNAVYGWVESDDPGGVRFEGVFDNAPNFVLEPAELPTASGVKPVRMILNLMLPESHSRYVLVRERYSSSANPDGPRHELVAIWDMLTGTCVARLDGPMGLRSYNSCISKDGRTLLISARRGERQIPECWLYDISRFAESISESTSFR